MFYKSDLPYLALQVLVCMVVVAVCTWVLLPNGLQHEVMIMAVTSVLAAVIITLMPLLPLGIAGMMVPFGTVTRWHMLPIGVALVWLVCKVTGKEFPDQS